jgi:hypothetical protein
VICRILFNVVFDSTGYWVGRATVATPTDVATQQAVSKNAVCAVHDRVKKKATLTFFKSVLIFDFLVLW